MEGITCFLQKSTDIFEREKCRNMWTDRWEKPGKYSYIH